MCEKREGVLCWAGLLSEVTVIKEWSGWFEACLLE